MFIECFSYPSYAHGYEAHVHHAIAGVPLPVIGQFIEYLSLLAQISLHSCRELMCPSLFFLHLFLHFLVLLNWQCCNSCSRLCLDAWRVSSFLAQVFSCSDLCEYVSKSVSVSAVMAVLLSLTNATTTTISTMQGTSLPL